MLDNAVIATINYKRDKIKCHAVTVNVPLAPLFWERDKRDTLL